MLFLPRKLPDVNDNPPFDERPPPPPTFNAKFCPDAEEIVSVDAALFVIFPVRSSPAKVGASVVPTPIALRICSFSPAVGGVPPGSFPRSIAIMLSLVVCDCVVVVDHSHAIVQKGSISWEGNAKTKGRFTLPLDRWNRRNWTLHTRSGQWGGVDCDLDVGGTGMDADCVGKVQHNGLASSKTGGVGGMGSGLRVDGDRAGCGSARDQRRVESVPLVEVAGDGGVNVLKQKLPLSGLRREDNGLVVERGVYSELHSGIR